MAVSKRLRYEILRRDNHACKYCGQAAPDVQLTVDHVIPTALGGSDEPSNLVAACKDCNAGKSASAPDAAVVADVDQRAVRWGLAMSVAVETRAAELAKDRALTRRFDKAWTKGSPTGVVVPRDANWKNSVLRFLAGGLDQEFLTDAIATAMGNDRLPDRDRWRYFCGICWRELDKLRDMAGELLDRQDGVVETAIPERWVHAMWFLSHADAYLHDVLETVCVPSEVREIATRGLWAAAEDAEEAFRAGPGEWDSVDERASEAFGTGHAWHSHYIQQYAKSAGLVPDGS